MADLIRPIETLADQQAYERMCLGKEQYPSEAAADAAIELFRKSGKIHHRSRLHSYACKFCGEWHYGHL